MVRKMLNMKFYEVGEVREILGLKSDLTVRKYIVSGKLKARKVGGRWKIAEENLRAFLTSSDIKEKD